MHKELPFETKIPNRATAKAMDDADKRKTHKAKSVDELFEDLGEILLKVEYTRKI